ncbi:MAG: transcription antitermination factor NusB [Clostridia bacterium]|nr:transcription antitermination factor NusB [Clostridia bacterium]
MTRRESRELAFVLLFEKSFSDTPLDEILENAGEAREIVRDPFALLLTEGVLAHTEEIDAQISEFSHKWSKERLSRIALAILRLAIYEMLWESSIPVSVSINEAVELAKRYGGDADASFINGVLGGIARRHEA